MNEFLHSRKIQHTAQREKVKTKIASKVLHIRFGHKIFYEVIMIKSQVHKVRFHCRTNRVENRDRR